MRIWLRIFVLAASISVVSIALTGILAVRTGYRALLEAEVRGLLRSAEATAALVTNAVRTAAYLSPPAPSPIEYMQQMPDPVPPGTGLEVYTEALQLVYSTGYVGVPPAAEGSPELAAAKAGRTTWTLRRRGTGPVLYLAARESAAGQPFILRVSTRLLSLDEYRSSQALLLGLSALAAAFLLGAAALAGSRAITRGLESLSSRASAIAAGDYAVRAVVRGRDEVTHLGRQFNRMADAVGASIRRLEQEKESRQAFIDDLTHELRTPVTSIVGFADHLRRHAWDERLSTEGLARIHDEGMRILAISEGLKRLLLSRTGTKALAEEDIVDLLGRAAADARVRHPGYHSEVVVTSGAKLAMDRDLILAALGNLLDNAARASSQGSTVRVAWVQDGAARQIVVSDPGGGDGPVEPGLGLGRAICREIADYHGGRLEYETLPGGGTAASIVFPNLP